MQRHPRSRRKYDYSLPLRVRRKLKCSSRRRRLGHPIASCQKTALAPPTAPIASSLRRRAIACSPASANPIMTDDRVLPISLAAVTSISTTSPIDMPATAWRRAAAGLSVASARVPRIIPANPLLRALACDRDRIMTHCQRQVVLFEPCSSAQHRAGLRFGVTYRLHCLRGVGSTASGLPGRRPANGRRHEHRAAIVDWAAFTKIDEIGATAARWCIRTISPSRLKYFHATRTPSVHAPS